MLNSFVGVLALELGPGAVFNLVLVTTKVVIVYVAFCSGRMGDISGAIVLRASSTHRRCLASLN